MQIVDADFTMLNARLPNKEWKDPSHNGERTSQGTNGREAYSVTLRSPFRIRRSGISHPSGERFDRERLFTIHPNHLPRRSGIEQSVKDFEKLSPGTVEVHSKRNPVMIAMLLDPWGVLEFSAIGLKRENHCSQEARHIDTTSAIIR